MVFILASYSHHLIFKVLFPSGTNWPFSQTMLSAGCQCLGWYDKTISLLSTQQRKLLYEHVNPQQTLRWSPHPSANPKR